MIVTDTWVEVRRAKGLNMWNHQSYTQTHAHTHTHTTSANTWCQKTQAWWKESVSPPSPHNGAKITLNLWTLTSHPKQHKLSSNQTLLNPFILLSRLHNCPSIGAKRQLSWPARSGQTNALQRNLLLWPGQLGADGTKGDGEKKSFSRIQQASGAESNRTEATSSTRCNKTSHSVSFSWCECVFV